MTQVIAAGEGEGALDEEIGVAVEFEESEEEEGEDELREVVVSALACDGVSSFLHGVQRRWA